MSASILLFLAGLALAFLGERTFPHPPAARLLLDLSAAAALVGSVGVRLRAAAGAEGAALRGHRRALALTLLAAFALLLYVLTLDGARAALGLEGEAARRWTAVLGAVWPVVLLAATAPLVLVDRVLLDSPRGVPARRLEVALWTGLSVAVGIALAFPVNYLAARHDRDVDLRYARTTAPGESTLALVRGLTEPVEAVLFFAPASDVARETRPYFEALAEQSPRFTVREVDQAREPALSRTLRVGLNGTVALVRGEQVERIRLGEDLPRARRALRTLDETVQGHLLDLTRPTRTLYFTVGHDEAHWRGADLPEARRLSDLKQVLEALNFRVAELGLEQGLAREVPADAAAVIVAAPRRALLPEELDTLRRYLQRGGRLWLLLEAGEPDAPDLSALAGLAGVRLEPAVLHNPRAFLVQTRTAADQALMLTNRTSTHPSVRTLNRNAGRLALVLPSTGRLEVLETAAARVQPTVRAMPGTWADLDGDHVQDEGEPVETFVVATASERSGRSGRSGRADGAGEDAGSGADPSAGRTAVLASAAAMSDPFLRAQANFQYAVDTVRWLTGDEQLVGTVAREEDVPLQHARDEDRAWFYGTVFAVPLAILFAGGLRVRRRRRRAEATAAPAEGGEG